MKKLILLIAVVILILAFFSGYIGRAEAKVEDKKCKELNSECNVNDSKKLCCDGLTCMNKGVASDIGKCEVLPTVTPTPKPPKDYCKNFEKDQKEIPYGMVSIDGYCDCADGFHRVEEELLRKPKKEYDTFTCEMNEPEPEATPTATICRENCGEAPTFARSSTEPPKCEATDTTETPVNPHVYRKGDVAIVKWWATDGNKVHIYYKENTASDWQYSAVFENTGYAEITGLGGKDITFGIMQVNDCSGGTTSSVSVIVDGPTSRWVLFR